MRILCDNLGAQKKIFEYKLRHLHSIPNYKKRSYKKRLIEILGTKKQQLVDFQITRNKFLWKLWNLQKNIDFLYIFHVLQEIYRQLLKI